jgi:hypothetical protein
LNVDVDPEVVSVSAIGAKKLEVKFNKAVDDTKAQFTVKKATSTIGVTNATWSEDKKSVVLELNSKMTEGTYEVSVTGLADSALVKSVAVENEKVAEIKVLSDKAVVKSGDATVVEVGYQLLNQYGEDITNSVLGNSSNFVVTSSVGTPTMDKGTISIDKGDNEFKEGDKLSLTIVDKATTTSTVANLTVAAESKVAEVTITGLYNKDNKTLSEDTLSDEFYLLFEAVDQYGNKVTDDAELENEVTVVVSNPAVVDVVKTNGKVDIDDAILVGNEKKVGLALVPAAKGETTITIIANATGKSVSYKVTVAEGVKTDLVSIGSPEGVVAGGEEILVPVDVTDNKGNAVTDLAVINHSTKGLDPNVASGGTFKKFVVKDGKVYAQIQTGNVAEGTTGQLVFTVTSATKQVATKVITVKPNAKPVAIKGLDSEVKTSLYEGTDLVLDWDKFLFEDQYGRAFKADEDGTKYKVVATEAVDGDGAISVDATNNETTASNADVNGIKITADEKGSELVTFTLKASTDGGNTWKDVSSVDVKFSVVAQSEFVSYEVGAVPTLYALDTANNDYAADFEVFGVTASGNKVKLPATEYNVILPTGLEFDQNGKISASAAAANLVDDDESTTKPLTKELPVKVIINDTGDEITSKVTVSAEAPKVAKVEFREDGDPNKDLLDTVEITDNVLDITDLEGYLYVEDQYGVAATVKTNANGAYVVDFADDDPTQVGILLTFSGAVNANGNNTIPTFKNNGTASASVINLEANDTVNAKVTISGVNSAVKVKVVPTTP